MKAVGAPSNRQITNSLVIANANTGQQSWNGIYFTSQAELSNINNQIGGRNNDTIPGSPTRFLLENLNMCMDFQNRGACPTTLHIYIVKPKRDCWSGTGASQMVFNPPNGGIQYPWDGEPLTAIQQGLNAQLQAGTGTDAYLDPAVSPTKVDLFNEYFRIERHQEVQMAVGGVHRLELNHHYDKVCDGSVFGNTPLTFLKGLTGCILIRVVGSPVQDLETTAEGATTLSPTSVSCVYTKSYRFTQVYSAQITSYENNTLIQAPDAVGTITLASKGTVAYS
jgi:hypothetical protein